MRKKRQHQRAQLNDSEDGTSADTSADERVPDTHEEDAEIHEPFKSRGEAVLEMALDKAVEQYEDKQTSRLVDDEYVVKDVDPRLNSANPSTGTRSCRRSLILAVRGAHRLGSETRMRASSSCEVKLHPYPTLVSATALVRDRMPC